MPDKKDRKNNGVNRRRFLRNVGFVGLGSTGLSLSANRAIADTVDAPEDKVRPDPVSVTSLKPAGDTTAAVEKALIKNVSLVEYPTTDRQSVRVEAQAGVPLEYSIVTDPDAKTYRISELEFLPGELNVRKPDELANVRSSSEPTVEPEGTSPIYDLTVAVTTHDPPHCKLCRTTQSLEWYYHSNYDATIIDNRVVDGRSWEQVCYIDLSTWYEDWNKFTDRYEGSSKCFTEAQGQYYCDNWDQNDKRTWSWHENGITGYSNGTSDYYGTGDHWGEDSEYLHMHVKVI